MRLRPLVVFSLIALFIHQESTLAQDADKYESDDVDVITYNITGRIVNGTKAGATQFPHQVSLRRSWTGKHFCGGSVISKQLVLTAAHCMYLDDEVIQPWSILVIGGEVQLSHGTKLGQSRGVRVILLHPKFSTVTFENDIAILELKAPFEYTPQLSPVHLPMDQVAPGTICQVSGWGYPAEGVKIVSDDLMYVDLPVLTMETCRQLLKNVTNITPGMYCAGYMEGLRDSCQGDSGGGMICNGMLMGIVSFGEGCARPRLPGIYTDVLYHKHWITYPMAYMRYVFDENNRGNSGNAVRSTSLTVISLLSLYFFKLILLT